MPSTHPRTLQLPELDCNKWEGYVHSVVWRVGRHFGFQAFNVTPRTQQLVRCVHVLQGTSRQQHTLAAHAPHTCRALPTPPQNVPHNPPSTQPTQRSQEFIPATIFVAADHISTLLCKNIYIRRTPGEDTCVQGGGVGGGRPTAAAA